MTNQGGAPTLGIGHVSLAHMSNSLAVVTFLKFITSSR